MTEHERVLSEASSTGVWFSQKYGQLSLTELVGKCSEKIVLEGGENKFKVIIGSDSRGEKNGAEFVTAIILYKVGHGASYFWQRVRQNYKQALAHRIRNEAWLSLYTAQQLLEQFVEFGLLSDNLLEIHVDIGTNGETRELISEVTGMIRANGFEYKIKPDAYAAQTVADRHT